MHSLQRRRIALEDDVEEVKVLLNLYLFPVFEFRVGFRGGVRSRSLAAGKAAFRTALRATGAVISREMKSLRSQVGTCVELRIALPPWKFLALIACIGKSFLEIAGRGSGDPL